MLQNKIIITTKSRSYSTSYTMKSTNGVLQDKKPIKKS